MTGDDDYCDMTDLKRDQCHHCQTGAKQVGKPRTEPGHYWCVD